MSAFSIARRRARTSVRVAARLVAICAVGLIVLPPFLVVAYVLGPLLGRGRSDRDAPPDPPR